MRLRFSLLWLVLASSTAMSADPTWWAVHGVKTTAAAANLAPATIGQAKHMAAMALAELQEHLPAATHQALQADLATIVDLSLPDPLPAGFYDSQKAVLLNGQLKAIAKPFYDHLRTHDAAWLDNAMTAGNLVIMEPGSDPPTPSPYPWSEAASDDKNKAPATLGQLKAVFSLPLETLSPPSTLDTDGDGMPDAWEIQNGFNPNSADDAALDSDGDGINNAMEFQLGLSPNSVNIVGPRNLGFDEEIPDCSTIDFRPLYPSDLYEDISIPGWKAAIGQHIEIWDGGYDNNFAERQSHLGSHGIKQTFQMLPGSTLRFSLYYRGRYDYFWAASDNAFDIKVEGAAEMLVDGAPASVDGNVRKHAFMETDSGNEWELGRNASIAITAPTWFTGLMPITLSLVPKSLTMGPEEISGGGFVDIFPEYEIMFKSTVGAIKEKLIVPIAESGNLPKICQQLQIYCNIAPHILPDFDGHVTITNKNPDNIKLWKSKDGNNENHDLGNTITIQIQDGQLQFTDQAPRDLFVKGISETTNAKIEAELVKDNAPHSGPQDTAILTVEVPVVGLREVYFSGDSSSYIPLVSDNDVAFPEVVNGVTNPHWKDSDGNGAPEMNHSIAYVRSSVPKIEPNIKLTNAAAYLGTAKLSATGSGTASNVKFVNQSLSSDESNSNTAVTSPPVVAVGNWPDKIMFYGKSKPDTSDRPAFELTWKISIDGGYEVIFSKSKHQAYITLDKPDEILLEKHCESLFYWSCDGAMGRASNFSDNIIKSIFDRHFSLDTSIPNDKMTRLIDPITGEEKNTQCIYDNKVGSILKTEAGMCAGWAKVFTRTAAVHNIAIQMIELRAVTKPNAGAFYTREQVKTDIGYVNRGGLLRGQGGLASQAVASWMEHAICKNGTICYDPAYGIRKNTEAAYEYAAFSGFTKSVKDKRDRWETTVIDSDPNVKNLIYTPYTLQKYIETK